MQLESLTCPSVGAQDFGAAKALDPKAGQGHESWNLLQVPARLQGIRSLGRWTRVSVRRSTGHLPWASIRIE